MSGRSWELVTADESTIVTEPILDATVVENPERDGCFPDPPRADESDRFKVFCELNDLLNKPVTSETSPRWRGR